MAGAGRTRSIALWSATGGAIAACGPIVAGFLLERFDLGSVFVVTLPLAVVALAMAWRFVPAHVNDPAEPVDNLGGILSPLLIGSLILAINFLPVPDMGTLALGLIARRRRGGIGSSSVNGAPRTRCTTSRSPAGGCSGCGVRRASSCSAH